MIKVSSALIWLSVVTVLVIVCAPFIGMENISVFDLGSDTIKTEIFWRIRAPRVLMAFLAGAGLGSAGMAFQSMFRNPLATPFTLGVASGASLGAALYVSLGLDFMLAGLPGRFVMALTGAFGAIALVYGLTRIKRGFSLGATLLAGVAVSFFFSSLILFLQYMADFARSFLILRWLMGGLDVVGYDSVLIAAPFVIIGSGVLFLLSRELDLLAVGEDIAISRGVATGRVKLTLFVVTSLMVGAVVATCGPIGFVGMMAPAIMRLVVGSDHRILAVATILFGGVFLTLCDTFARIIIAPAEIPVGVITALLGGPFFLWLLIGENRAG